MIKDKRMIILYSNSCNQPLFTLYFAFCEILWRIEYDSPFHSLYDPPFHLSLSLSLYLSYLLYLPLYPSILFTVWFSPFSHFNDMWVPRVLQEVCNSNILTLFISNTLIY